MIHGFERVIPGAHAPSKMSTVLRALARSLGDPSFTGLSMRASRRLTLACNGFAELIQAAEATPDKGKSLKGSARFLVSALAALRAPSCALPLSERDEAWLLAEIESELGEAIALFDAQMGRPRSAVPPRPTLDLC